MKKQTTIIFVLVSLIVGGLAGFYAGGRAYTRIWMRVVEEQLVSSSLWHVTSMYHAEKLLKDRKTEEAEQFLQVMTHSALQSVDLLSVTLQRPDMLTNSDVVSARLLDKDGTPAR
jgi:hypothetical protein